MTALLTDRPSASAALRRGEARATSYVLELGLLNTGAVPLTSWEVKLTPPIGAQLLGNEYSTVERDPQTGVVTACPTRPGTLIRGQRQIIPVWVHGTDRAPLAAQFCATACDGTARVAVDVVAAVVDGRSRTATESTWPGCSAIACGRGAVNPDRILTDRAREGDRPGASPLAQLQQRVDVLTARVAALEDGERLP
jgi:hypothetical protein